MKRYKNLLTLLQMTTVTFLSMLLIFKGEVNAQIYSEEGKISVPYTIVYYQNPQAERTLVKEVLSAVTSEGIQDQASKDIQEDQDYQMQGHFLLDSSSYQRSSIISLKNTAIAGGTPSINNSPPSLLPDFRERSTSLMLKRSDINLSGKF